MKKFILYIWQLPQNIIGLILVLVTRARKYSATTNFPVHYIIRNPENYKYFGVSLGNYIVFGNEPTRCSLLHEKGHQKQSLYLGWFYLFVIGVPSAFGNIFDRAFHRNWTEHQRIVWYYSQPWESWADKLGKVNRFCI